VTTEQARRSSYFDEEEPAPYSPRPGFSGRSWEGDSLEEAEGFRRRIPSRDEAEDDFYRPRRPSRVAIPERAVSRGGEPSDWEAPRRRPEPGPAGFEREGDGGGGTARYSAGGSRPTPADFGARRRGRDGEEVRRGSRPVAAAEAMPRSSRRPGEGSATGNPLSSSAERGGPRGQDVSDADYAPLGPRGPQGRPISPQGNQGESSRTDGPRAQAPRGEAPRGEAPRGEGSRGSGDPVVRPGGSGRPAARDNSSRFDD
jgi:hypothetical protein